MRLCYNMKQYICTCGCTFDNPQKFNGHKRHCLVHAKLTGKAEHLHEADIQAAKTGREKGKSKITQRQEEKNIKDQAALVEWIQAKHTCKKCGKIMTEKFGSGIFCSRSCANSHNHSQETRERISKGVQDSLVSIDISEGDCKKVSKTKASNVYMYIDSPNRCNICGKVLDYSKRKNKTCGDKECIRKQIEISCNRSEKVEHKGKHTLGSHIVYKVVNDFDDRYYIGVRKTEDTVFDGYLGSGVHIGNMIRHYGKEHFKRITLFKFDNSTDAYNKEKELLKDCLNDPLCVNLASGGQGGVTFKGRSHSDETKALIAQKRKSANKQ